MKQDWDIKKLGDICEFGNGLWTGKKPPFINVGVIRNANFTKEGKLDDSDIVYLDVEQSQFVKRMLKYGDIILEKSGGGPKQPVGRVVIFDKEVGNYSFSNFTSLIRIKNPNQIDFNYLYLYLFFSYISGVTETMQSHSTGIRNLKFDEYKQISVPIPPLPEQKRIVAILDESFASIAKAKVNAELNLKNARELFESYLQGVFENDGEDWKEKSLGEVCDVIGGGTPSKSNGSFYNGNIHWATVRDMKGEYLTDTEHKITQDAIKQSSTNIIPKGNVVIATRVGLGKVCLLRYDTAINQDLKGIIPKKTNELSVDFLFRWFKSISNKIIEEGTGATVQGVKMPFIKSLKISFPSLTTQQFLVQKLDALSSETKRLESIYLQKLNDLEELKKSILQKAFNGELKVS